ncbi:nicotinate-nucleotide--dimethylbenzimidazole phosphoribosyltransferase [Shewanella sp. GXUN23E]|uniref:nicotinate-nucleotide--dimethylbenzimidazole phosphoribosyltransferase n=1 Tax=Shewanella sp. GXUN23E TaxID=3422498 RepID=UPI003D7D5467
MNNYNIHYLNNDRDAAIQATIDHKTKPPGALGELEVLARQLARIQQSSRLNISRPVMLVFAADHGIAAHGVSIAPQAVTRQMVMNFVAGGAAINVFCAQNGWQMEVVDAGILEPVDCEQVTQCRLGAGTHAFHLAPAMTQRQVEEGFDYARALVEKHHQLGSNVIAFGEMGIGNTSAAAAIMSAMMDLDVAVCVGRGTGVDDQTLTLKRSLIARAVERHKPVMTGPREILACVGGFEIVQITGAILAAAEKRMLVVIDGFIASAAAMLAVSINAACREYMVFAHESSEQGHQLMLRLLDARPLLRLGLRLGEGTGAALALPLIQAAANFYNDMASFDAAQVTDVSTQD